ncbi:hypothetical protein HMPREF0591_5637 [Mycobacterium parascrofulaceum ATCC BAA-614]|uniref:Methyltransferase domain protein n=2 Tax=Mycobacterium parascrofulaceum TaxID=240125 RepID=D5PHJ3_9MYCO|nr:hypothetical protein HMPREF0591_5637 [Mycobacterium parascrofulaceum ATCC BAA-614]
MMKTQIPSQCVQTYWGNRRSVPGAFWDIDFLLFDQILQMQSSRGICGNLLEIGALFGKSAIVLGRHVKPQEKAIVCDIFDYSGANPENAEENSQSYKGLNRTKFEQNYLKWVEKLPEIINELSSNITERVETKSLRFAHVDGSHLFEVVGMDVANTRRLMNDFGVVAIDDFRAVHTPGVAAAVWAAVCNDDLMPICISEQKFYGSWSPEVAAKMRADLTRWAASQHNFINYGTQDVAGKSVLIIQNPPPWGGKVQLTLRIPNPWRPISIVIEIPAPWKKHIAALRMRDVVNLSWGRPYLGMQLSSENL